MVITAKAQSRYGGSLVTQKYSPLEGITLKRSDTTFHNQMFSNRLKLFESTKTLPRPLRLTVKKWETILADERDHGPPLMVISSNRSQWIAAGHAAAKQQLAALGIDEFQGAQDLRALTGAAGQRTSPPIYLPVRNPDSGLTKPRNVYVIVHQLEYAEYLKNLKDTNIIVVGWSFTPPRGARPNSVVSGFGASRYAAIEFAKYLRRRVASRFNEDAPWKAAWLFDDNAVGITSFKGLESVEGQLADASSSTACAGMQGDTKAFSQAKIKEWATNTIRAGRAIPAPDSKPPGIIQQAALWNISYFDENFLNFSPIFLTSGEDVSMSTYFDLQEIPYLWYPGMKVQKEVTTFYDNGDGANALNVSKTEWARKFVRAEASATPTGANPPPPVTITPPRSGATKVRDFVVNKVLPSSLEAAKKDDAAMQNKASSQAVEQILIKAIAAGFVSASTLKATFKLNGEKQQRITPMNSARQ